MPTLSFTREDLEDVFPHDNDPMVISVVMKSRRIHRVLVDQGSSVDVLFWDAFVAIGGSLEELEPYEGVLVGFSGDPVQVRGYIQARTTFEDDSNTKTCNKGGSKDSKEVL